MAPKMQAMAPDAVERTRAVIESVQAVVELMELGPIEVMSVGISLAVWVLVPALKRGDVGAQTNLRDCIERLTWLQSATPDQLDAVLDACVRANDPAQDPAAS